MTDETVTPLLHWLRAATRDQQERVASLAGTTRIYLYQLASDKGGRGFKISARLALKIEDAMQEIAAETKGALPAVTARQLAGLKVGA